MSYVRALAVLVLASVLLTVGAASANTVPNWFWKWADWYRHGKVSARPAHAPEKIPAWSWKLLVRHQQIAAQKRVAGAPAAKTQAPAPAPAAPGMPSSNSSPAPSQSSSPAPAPAPTTTTKAATTTTAPAPPPPPAPPSLVPTTTTTAPAPTPPPAPAPSGLSSAEASLLSAVNAARAQNGLGALTIDSNLETAARAHTQNLSDNNAFTHDFIKDGVSYPFSTWIGWYYHGTCAGENLAWGTTLDASTAVSLWLNSPGHRANMLSSAFHTVGVALQGKPGQIIATTDFGGC